MVCIFTINSRIYTLNQRNDCLKVKNQAQWEPSQNYKLHEEMAPHLNPLSSFQFLFPGLVSPQLFSQCMRQTENTHEQHLLPWKYYNNTKAT